MDFQYLNSVISHVYRDNFDTEERASDENSRVTGSPRERARSLCKVSNGATRRWRANPSPSSF